MNARPKRKPIKWPDGARIAITPCVAFETWPEDLGGPFSQQQQNRRGWPKNATTKKDLYWSKRKFRLRSSLPE